jgi:hypothetical protein
MNVLVTGGTGVSCSRMANAGIKPPVGWLAGGPASRMQRRSLRGPGSEHSVCGEAREQEHQVDDPGREHHGTVADREGHPLVGADRQHERDHAQDSRHPTGAMAHGPLREVSAVEKAVDGVTLPQHQYGDAGDLAAAVATASTTSDTPMYRLAPTAAQPGTKGRVRITASGA